MDLNFDDTGLNDSNYSVEDHGTFEYSSNDIDEDDLDHDENNNSVLSDKSDSSANHCKQKNFLLDLSLQLI